MRTAVFQMDPVYGMPAWNIDKACLWIEGLKGKADLAVLPETFDTGGARCGETGCAAAMAEAAAGSGVAVCFTTVDEGYNRFFFIAPDGRRETYDKRHLFPLSAEASHLRRGTGRHTFEYMGMRILPQICYDLRFPVWSRNDPEMPYDIAVYPASWPGRRIEAWDVLLRARAVENMCYVIGAGRTGYGYPGHSAIVDFRGETLAAADPDLECGFTAQLSKEKLDGFRSNFCTFGDCDKYTLK